MRQCNSWRLIVSRRSVRAPSVSHPILVSQDIDPKIFKFHPPTPRSRVLLPFKLQAQQKGEAVLFHLRPSSRPHTCSAPSRSSPLVATTSTTSRNSTRFRKSPSSSSSRPHRTCLLKHPEQRLRSPVASWPIMKVSLHSIPSLYLISRVTVVELGLVIGTPGRDISQADALKHIAGYSEFPSLSL